MAIKYIIYLAIYEIVGNIRADNCFIHCFLTSKGLNKRQDTEINNRIWLFIGDE